MNRPNSKGAKKGPRLFVTFVLFVARRQIIADSAGDGYSDKADCEHAIDLLKREVSPAKVLDLTVETPRPGSRGKK